MDTPWFAIASAENSGEYVALLTGLSLKSYRGLPRFLLFLLGTVRQVRRSPGAIGLALRARLFSLNFWTLTAWQNEQLLREFVMKPPHFEAMKAMVPYMKSTNFLRWKVTGAELPLRWADAMRRFEQGAQK
jgi:hypothetical protein